MFASIVRHAALVLTVVACGAPVRSESELPRASSPLHVTRAPSGEPFRIIGYCLPQTCTRVDLGHLTHVFYAFATPHADGSIDVPGLAVQLHELVRRAHAAQVLVSLSVGGWMNGDDSAFHALAATPRSRARFARELRNVVDTFALDGVDLDWEYPEGSAARDYAALIGTVRSALDARTLLTAAVGADERSAAGLSRDALSNLSFVEVMAYDADDKDPAPFELAQDALALWRDKGVRAHELVLGVPFYSRPSFLPFWEIVQRDPANADRDRLRGESYNGRPTIAAKTRLALARASGVMAWELGQDAPGEHSLLRTIARTAHDSRAQPAMAPITSHRAP